MMGIRLKTWLFGEERKARVEYRDGRTARVISKVKRRVIYKGNMMIIRGKFEEFHVHTDHVRLVHISGRGGAKTTNRAEM